MHATATPPALARGTILEEFGRKMRILFWGLIAFDLGAIWVIVRTTSFALTMALVTILLLTNILLAMALRRILSLRTDLSVGRIITLLHWASWTG